jgi:hypothetical protein
MYREAAVRRRIREQVMSDFDLDWGMEHELHVDHDGGVDHVLADDHAVVADDHAYDVHDHQHEGGLDQHDGYSDGDHHDQPGLDEHEPEHEPVHEPEQDLDAPDWQLDTQFLDGHYDLVGADPDENDMWSQFMSDMHEEVNPYAAN